VDKVVVKLSWCQSLYVLGVFWKWGNWRDVHGESG